MPRIQGVADLEKGLSERAVLRLVLIDDRQGFAPPPVVGKIGREISPGGFVETFRPLPLPAAALRVVRQDRL